MPKQYVGPPKDKVEHLSTWEYLEVVWDFDSQHARVPWQASAHVPPSVASCYKHMWEMKDQYEPWLQAKLGYWATRSDSLRELHPDWRAVVAEIARVWPRCCRPSTTQT